MSEAHSVVPQDLEESGQDTEEGIITEADSKPTNSGTTDSETSSSQVAAEEQAVRGDEELPQRLQELTSVIGQLQGTVTRFATQQPTLATLNSQLQARVEELEKDQVRTLLKPVFERLAALYTQAYVSSVSSRDRDPESSEDFAFFGTSILELMELYDVVSVEADIGVPFDPKKHAAIRRNATDDQELDGLIARVQRQGFAFVGDERVLLPARVAVHRYTSVSTQA